MNIRHPGESRSLRLFVRSEKYGGVKGYVYGSDKLSDHSICNVLYRFTSRDVSFDSGSTWSHLCLSQLCIMTDSFQLIPLFELRYEPITIFTDAEAVNCEQVRNTAALSAFS